MQPPKKSPKLSRRQRTCGVTRSHYDILLTGGLAPWSPVLSQPAVSQSPMLHSSPCEHDNPTCLHWLRPLTWQPAAAVAVFSLGRCAPCQRNSATWNRQQQEGVENNTAYSIIWSLLHPPSWIFEIQFFSQSDRMSQYASACQISPKSVACGDVANFRSWICLECNP